MIKNNKFDLMISGLPVAKYSAVETFFIALDSNSDSKSVQEFGEVEDILYQTYKIFPMTVRSFERSSYFWIV